MEILSLSLSPTLLETNVQQQSAFGWNIISVQEYVCVRLGTRERILLSAVKNVVDCLVVLVYPSASSFRCWVMCMIVCVFSGVRRVYFSLSLDKVGLGKRERLGNWSDDQCCRLVNIKILNVCFLFGAVPKRLLLYSRQSIWIRIGFKFNIVLLIIIKKKLHIKTNELQTNICWNFNL